MADTTEFFILTIPTVICTNLFSFLYFISVNFEVRRIGAMIIININLEKQKSYFAIYNYCPGSVYVPVNVLSRLYKWKLNAG